MIRFDAAHEAVHHPPDRRFRIWIKPSFVVVAICLGLIPLLLAWGQAAIFGMPYLAPLPKFNPTTFTGVHGFPWWLRWAHFFNFVFLMMLVRSGLSILVDHPRLYFNNDCTPGSEWIRFTPLHVPTDRIWTAKDDARYISPIFGLPGYRHTVGVARSWHFIDVYGFILTGLTFIPLLFLSGQWARLVRARVDRKGVAMRAQAECRSLAIFVGVVFFPRVYRLAYLYGFSVHVRNTVSDATVEIRLNYGARVTDSRDSSGVFHLRFEVNFESR